MDWAKTTAWEYQKHLNFEIWCDLYKRFYGSKRGHWLLGVQWLTIQFDSMEKQSFAILKHTPSSKVLLQYKDSLSKYRIPI